MPNQPMGDVYNVYERWSGAWLHGGYVDPSWYSMVSERTHVGFVGITEPWVYPQLALVPMLLAWLFAWAGGYTIGWAILVTVADAAAFALLVGTGRATGRTVAAWFWLSFIALLGPVGIYRLDGFTVPLAIAGCLWLVGRPWLGSALLAIATWIKVWPAALVVAAVVALRRRLVVVAAGLAVSAATLLVVVVLGGGAHAFGFIADQSDRGIQLEAPVGTLYLWQAVAGVAGSSVYYDFDLITFQVTGPHVDAVIAVMTPLQILAVVALAAPGAVKVWRGASFAALFPRLALGLVLAFIVFNKVGSPQYMTWIVAPLVVGMVVDRRHWWGPAALALAIAFLTQAVYPLTYWQLVSAQPIPAALLTARNVLLVALFAWVVVMIARVAPHPHVHARLQRQRAAAS
nr:hypothetical protein [Microbacterium ulmi]